MGTLFKSSGYTYKNVENFECISPEDYPQQNNLWVKQASLYLVHCFLLNSFIHLNFFQTTSFTEFYKYLCSHNCALYAIMYMDIWDGKNMKEFDDVCYQEIILPLYLVYV